MTDQKLTVKDHRTGKEYELPITDGTVNGMALRQIKVDEDDFGLMSYDPAFKNTASCRSSITEIDGDKGILRYRGYPIEQLERHSSYLECAYLLLYGELPTTPQLREWKREIKSHTMLHENIKKFLDGFHYDAHPMSMLISSVAALSTFYSDARNIEDEENRHLQIVRIIAKIASLGAYTYRHALGLPYTQPDNNLSYVGNFLSMAFRMTEREYVPNQVIERALEVLFILHMDHEQNCSTNAMRSVGSSHTDPYSAVSAAIAALFGPLHGGANEAVLRMLDQVTDVSQIPKFIKRAKSGEIRLMGFGHRVYKNYDPRARIIKDIAHQVFETTGRDKKLDIALELERIALEDDYFIERKLYPNVDFYSGLIYESMKFPLDFFPVLFAIPRVVGWLSQWEEMMRDPEQKIARPRQIYTGSGVRDYLAVDDR